MSLFEKPGFDAFAGGLTGVTFVDQWESRVAKVGGKVFALLSTGADGVGRIVFKVAEESFEILTAIEGIGQAPYFAKRQWISVSSTADLPQDDVGFYIRRSHALVARGLTKKLRGALGIEVA